MSNDNRVSAELSAQDVTEVLGALETVRQKMPFLLTLSTQERREMAKMGEKSIGFDEKCAAYMASNPEFLPGFVDIAEVKKDRALRAQLLRCTVAFTALAESMDDTLMVASSELWMADLAYYQAVREAARRGRAGAETIYEDLRLRFPGAGPGSAPPAGPISPAKAAPAGA